VPTPDHYRLSGDARRLLAVQALRGFAYGLGSVLIGVSLERAGRSGAQVGLVLGALLAGTALVSLLLARYGDRVGRRRAYRLLLGGMGVAGTVFAVTTWPPALVAAALSGTVSPEVVESGPLTSLEQAMLPHTIGRQRRTWLFGRYNTVATLAGSLGALAAGGPALLDRWLPAPPAAQLLLLAYPLAAALGLLVAAGLSPAMEADHQGAGGNGRPLQRSRGIVRRLAGLFALDSFGGGFVVQTFVAYWFARRFGASAELLGVVFFLVGLLQAVSFQLAVRLADRIGLLQTMVATHLPSNLLLAAVAFAPTSQPRWRCCSPGSRSARWTCPPARPTWSASSTRPSGPRRPPTPTPPAIWPAPSRPWSPVGCCRTPSSARRS
jgi:MFS family permease